MSILEGVGVKHDGVRFSDVYDGGRRERSSSTPARDEIVAEGVYSGSARGFGFVSLADEDAEDIFIPEGKSGGAIDGDYVEIIYHTYSGYSGERRTEGRVRRILKIGREVVIGTLEYERVGRRYGQRAPRRILLVPDEPKISLLPRVADTAGARVGDKVAVKIRRGTGAYNSPECAVVAVLGRPGSREANYGAVLLECGIPTDFTEEELLCAESAARTPIDYDAREDRRTDVIFTIDGAGAKDLDDAISLRKTAAGWLLGVHIADVSHYVKERTALDRAVMERGTSVYFTDKVVPMLPPALSNGACSLNAGEDKCAMSAFISLDREGAIRSVRVSPTVIRSRVRGVYSEVNAIFDGVADGELLAKYKAVLPTLAKMKELYLVLKSRAEARGMLELDLPESVILLDGAGEPCDIIRAERGDAERLIEQFMLTANEAVAAMLRERGMPCVYRVHEAPPEDKLREFLEYATNMGLDIKGITPESPTPCQFSALLAEAEEKGVYPQASYSLLRAMSKAKYSDVGTGHFGLAIADYCHFTSPIRRLSDLATHRIIRRVLFEGKSPRAYISYARRAAAAATESELRAVTAERRIEELYKAIYMKDKVGECFLGAISSTHSFGAFVTLENTCEGLIPVEDMPGYFVYDEKNFSIRSRSMTLRVGDNVTVRLEEVDMNRCKLKFSLVLE